MKYPWIPRWAAVEFSLPFLTWCFLFSRSEMEIVQFFLIRNDQKIDGPNAGEENCIYRSVDMFPVFRCHFMASISIISFIDFHEYCLFSPNPRSLAATYSFWKWSKVALNANVLVAVFLGYLWRLSCGLLFPYHFFSSLNALPKAPYLPLKYYFFRSNV